MNYAEPPPMPTVAPITTPAIITYVVFTLVVALLLSWVIAPIWILLAFVVFYVACLSYRKFQPNDTSSQVGRVAKTVHEFGSVVMGEAKRAHNESSARFWRYFVVPRRNGGLGFFGLLFLSLCTLTAFFLMNPSLGRSFIRERPVEENIAETLGASFNEEKQKIFDHFHPIGTAKNVMVHEVAVVAWKHGKNTNRFEDIQQFTVRYTLFWKGPITTDGFTQIEQIYDNEIQRYVSAKVLQTNGTTNSEVGSALGDFGVKLLYQALSGE